MNIALMVNVFNNYPLVIYLKIDLLKPIVYSVFVLMQLSPPPPKIFQPTRSDSSCKEKRYKNH